jgi:hypothetical protein
LPTAKIPRRRTPRNFQTGSEFILLCFLLIGCDRRDAKLSQQVLGTWNYAGAARGGMDIASDGHFSSIWTKSEYQGTWVVKEGVLVMTCTNASGPNREPVGRIERFRIVEVDSSRLALECNGQTNCLERR